MKGIEETTRDGLRHLTWRQGGLEIGFVPDLGGKITLLRRQGRHNVLLTTPEFPLRTARFGAPFHRYDTSGFDEYFPTIEACPHPTLAGNPPLPDHGDIWSLPVEVRREGEAVVLESDCRSLPCTFFRRMSVTGDVLRLEYEVRSLSDTAFPVLWSAHPLLATSEDSQLFLPKEVDTLTLHWSTADGLGQPGSRLPWPLCKGRRLNHLAGPQARLAERFFTPRLTVGWGAHWDQAKDEHVFFRFDPQVTPYLGLWICQGGWPVDRPTKHFTVALEPCTSPARSLADAQAHGETLTLPAKGSARWYVEVGLGKGKPVIPG